MLLLLARNIGKITNILIRPFNRRIFNRLTAFFAQAASSLSPSSLMSEAALGVTRRVPSFDNRESSVLMIDLYKAAGFGPGVSGDAALEVGVRLAKIGCDVNVPARVALNHARQCGKALATRSSLPSLSDLYRRVDKLTSYNQKKALETPINMDAESAIASVLAPSVDGSTERRHQLLTSIGSSLAKPAKIDHYFNQLREYDEWAVVS